MKRLYFLAALLAFSPSAHAGSSISFSVGGHRIHIEASPHCRSTSCASVSVDSRRKGDRSDDDNAAAVKPAPPAPQTVTPPAPPANVQPVQTIVAPPPAVYKPAAAATQIVAAPPPPMQQVAIPVPPAPPPPVQQVAIPVPPPIVTPAEVARPSSPIARVSNEVAQEEADTPVGDWQTEGRGAVRIARCGNALCGYVLNSSSDDRGEAVLINMKPKNDTQWTGSVYSQDSGDTYYGTMDMKTSNTLRVEACALGRFYCSGNSWSRITGRAASLMTSRQVSAEPRS